MMLGGIVTAVAAVLYLASGNLAYLMAVRLAHGLSIAAYYTAASTMVADAAPEERRGEALSYFSMFLYVGLAGGGALGLALHEGPGLTAVFLASAGIGVACALISISIPEPRAHTPEGIEIERHPLISRPALFPGAVLALGAFGYASILNFTADFAGAEGIGGRTLYFPVLAGSVVVVRLFAGLVSDRFGRLVVGGPGLALFAIGVLVQSGARDTGSLLLAAAIAGIGFGFFFPSMMAFTIDRVRPVERGSAMGTFTGAFDLGFGIGSLALGTIKDATDYPTMYRGAAAFVAVGVLLLVAGARRARDR
jgi:MFS family permease